MFVQQSQYTIETLVARIRTGRLALPDFQRDFVWSPSQVADLLESIAKEWPIGSLLLLNGPQPFAFRSIDSAPKLLNPDLDLYVLDGQQRVTSIYHAVQDVSQFVYYVDFSAAVPEDDEVILWERRTKFERRYKSLTDRAAASIALVRDFWDNERFQEWLNLQEQSTRNKYMSMRERRLGGLQSKVYKLLAIELEQGIELEALAKIFETLNKTGVRLNAFDLLVAKLYPSSFNLREEWDKALKQFDELALYSPDGLEVIKLAALLIRRHEGRGLSRGVRQGDVLQLDAKLVKQYWPEAVDLYLQALRTLREFGVTASYLVPNWSMVLGIAACISGPRPELTRPWWMSRLRGMTFAQAANTRVVAEFDAIQRGEYNIDNVDNGNYRDLLLLPVRPNGLLLKGIMSLAIKAGARDPITGALLSEVSKVEAAELTEAGSIAKISQETSFENVIFLSEEGLRLSRIGVDIRAESLGADVALHSQGFDAQALSRQEAYLKWIFQ